MAAHHPLFGQHTDWLSQTLNQSKQTILPTEMQLPTGRLCCLKHGILCFHPHNKQRNGLILSAGIHGNETAPIEILNTLISEIVAQKIEINRPVLFILGHPQAIAEQKRFVEVNLNRLFCGAHQSPEYKDTIEGIRAKQIESVVCAFDRQYKVNEHFDLHTAIRESVFERFALYPFRPDATPKPDQLAMLSLCGIEHLLQQSKPSTTFSSFTSTRFHSESYTLELGRVKPFGENDLHHYLNVQDCLKKLITKHHLTVTDHKMSFYEVSHEILHTGPTFQFFIPDDVKNFTAYPKDSVIWKDAQTEYRVQADEELIVFPNRHVPQGQRAGLMIRKT